MHQNHSRPRSAPSEANFETLNLNRLASWISGQIGRDFEFWNKLGHSAWFVQLSQPAVESITSDIASVAFAGELRLPYFSEGQFASVSGVSGIITFTNQSRTFVKSRKPSC